MNKLKYIFKNKKALSLVILFFIFVGLFLLKYQTSFTLRLNKLVTNNIILTQQIRKVSDILFVLEKIKPHKLETYEVLIEPAKLKKLNDNLPSGGYEELEAKGVVFGAISGENKLFVPATFVYEGKKYDIKIRYRGLSYDHWYFPKKSWLIKFTDESPLGREKVNLIIPRDRFYLGEKFNQYRSEKFGLITLASGFVNLKINGEKQGIYFWLEDWSKKVLASNDRNTSGCLFGADFIPTTNLTRDPAFDEVGLWKEYTNTDYCQDYGFANLDKLLSLLKEDVSETEFSKNIEQILDTDLVLKWNLVYTLAGSVHGTGYNMRLYFNDKTEKFEFIPWDLSIKTIKNNQIDPYYNEITARLLKEDKYFNKRNEILWNYVKNEKNLKADLAHYDELLAKTKIDFYKDSNKTASNLKFNEKIEESRNLLIQNFKKIKELLSSDPIAYVYVIKNKPYKKSIRVETLGNMPAYIESIICDNDCTEFLDVYWDKNNNGLVDEQDIKIPTKKEAKELLLLQEIPINSERSLMSPENKYMQLKPKAYNFILTSPNLEDIEIDEIVLRNFITKEKIEYTLRQLNYENVPSFK